MCYNKVFLILLSFVMKKVGDFASALGFYANKAGMSQRTTKTQHNKRNGTFS